MRHFCWLMLMLAALPAACGQSPPYIPPAEVREQALPPTDVEAIFQRLAQQDAEIERLRAQVAAATPPRADELASVQPPIPVQPSGQPTPADGWIDVSSEKWTVKLGGHVQLDTITWAQASPAIVGDQNYFEFRRLRLVADGTGYGVLDFRLQMTLEPETVGESGGAATSPDVKDAYLSMNEIPWLGRFRIGNFFVPFSLEQVTNDTNNIFLERSIPSNGVFAADREVGMAIYNCTPDERITWAGGVFFDGISDTLKERIDDNQGCRVSGRLTWLPYYDEPTCGRYLVHTGVGVLFTDDQDDRVRFRARPQIHEGPRLIDSGALLASSYTTGNVELAVVNGPITVQSEAFVSSVNLIGDESTNVQGAYVHLSYFLTGENRIFERFGQHGPQFGRNVPYSNFFIVPGCVSPGAWELKTRWSCLDLNQVDAGQYNDLTVGFNWYWNDRVRVMFDWIHPVTSSQTVFGETESNILGMRFDWNW
jgi:phosphate-selective porin OprO and OprP